MAIRSNKVSATERNFPHIVEIELPVNGLDLRLSREITAFHRSRDITQRFGRRLTRNNQKYCRWCFDDPAIADTFCEQFGGARVTQHGLAATSGSGPLARTTRSEWKPPRKTGRI